MGLVLLVLIVVGITVPAPDDTSADATTPSRTVGFEDKASFAFFTAEDLQDDVAKDCLEATTAYKARLDRFTTYVGALHDTGANLQAARFISNQQEPGKKLDGTGLSVTLP